MSDQESLSDILSGKDLDDDSPEPTGDAAAKAEPATPAAGKTEKVEADPKAATAGDDPKAPAKVDDAKAPKAEDPPKGDAAPASKPRGEVAAIIELRKRAQAAEARVRELEAGKPAAKPSVFENEDEAISSRVNEATRPIREMLYQQSMRSARSAHGDEFDAAAEAFAEAAQSDESLITGLRQASDPGEYVFAHGVYHAKLAPHGGDVMKMLSHETGALKSQVTERDTRIKALEAQVAELTQQKADLESLPRNLNSKSSGAAPKAGDEDDEDLHTIVRFGNKSR